MKKLLKIVLIIVCLLGVLLALGVTVTIGWRPFFGPRARGLTSRRFDATPERLARGKYLVQSTLVCFDCHSDHDWKAAGMPALPGREGAGWVIAEEGLPGRIVAQNLTPDRETGTGTWSDDQLARAIREGVGHDGRALFPMMPYRNFRRLPDEDLASVVVYLRSLPGVHNPLPPTEMIFPVKYLIRSVPEPLTEPVSAPDLSTPERRGEYLVTLAGCADCHTPMDRGRSNESKAFAGGNRFKGPWGDVLSANITPDKTGISYYNEALFLEMMRTGNVMGRQLNAIMPWGVYRNMTDDDLKSIWAYLRTVKPVENRVRRTAAE
ncbi:MAG TPA: c-type cytochrome [Terriglobales bacterium]|nr:c-type cytochrome [Terriglobales bacterium]